MNNEKESKQPEQRRRCAFVDTKMLPCKAGHFIFYSALGCFIPYMNVFFVSAGLTAKEAGFISGICTVFSALASPAWGFLADYTGKRKLILIFLCISTSLIVVAQPLVVWKINRDYMCYCQNLLNATGLVSNCHYENVSWTNTTSVEECFSSRKPFSSILFCATMIMYVMVQCICMPMCALLDAFIMNIVKRNKETCFGDQRVFGSIGFGISSFLAGVAADNYSQALYSKYTPVFYMGSPIFLFLIPIGLKLLKQTNWQVEGDLKVIKDTKDYDSSDLKDSENTNNSVNLIPPNESKFNLVLLRLRDVRNLFFFLSILVVGITTHLFFAFNFLLMDKEMNASKTAMGLVTFVSCFAETLLFPFTGRIIKYFGSPLPCIEIGALSFVIRLTLISYIKNAWLCIPVQVLHSLGFALFWAAAVEYVESISLSIISSTMFGILSSIYFGVGSLIGNMGGGVLYHRYGGRVLFRGQAIFTFCWVIIMFFYIHVFRCHIHAHTETENSHGSNDIDVTENGVIDEAEGEHAKLMNPEC